MIRLIIENGINSFVELKEILMLDNIQESSRNIQENKLRDIDPTIIVALIGAGAVVIDSIISNITTYVIEKKKLEAEEKLKPTPIIMIQVIINNELLIEKSSEKLIELKDELEIIDTTILEKDEIDLKVKFY